MPAPNLFSHATKELSQDAFLCWLLDWANKAYAQTDPQMHRAGRMFLNALLAKHGILPVDSPRIESGQRCAGPDAL
jgi:hypothetical protein